jgi:hypothetical protein
LEVLDNVDKERRSAAVNHHYGVNKSANCFTKINEDENRGSIRSQSSRERKKSLVLSHHEPFLKRMERALCE